MKLYNYLQAYDRKRRERQRQVNSKALVLKENGIMDHKSTQDSGGGRGWDNHRGW